ncbi:MAG: hypothetical protein IJM25_09250 [Eubacterium sp.]|nr:hypothetical protein [Eubacterium sp.]
MSKDDKELKLMNALTDLPDDMLLEAEWEEDVTPTAKRSRHWIPILIAAAALVFGLISLGFVSGRPRVEEDAEEAAGRTEEASAGFSTPVPGRENADSAQQTESTETKITAEPKGTEPGKTEESKWTETGETAEPRGTETGETEEPKGTEPGKTEESKWTETGETAEPRGTETGETEEPKGTEPGDTAENTKPAENTGMKEKRKETSKKYDSTNEQELCYDSDSYVPGKEESKMADSSDMMICDMMNMETGGGLTGKGWLRLGTKWYYFHEGNRFTGVSRIDGTWYIFDDDGVLQSTIGTKLTDGWKKVGNYWYYFKNGALVDGELTIGGKEYTFEDSRMTGGP